ncbi:MAG: MurR/RpiR family transcriptional regulator [Succinivibrio sp.]
MANILDRIAAETDLTKSERKLAEVILKDPAQVVNENIAQLAKRAGVSDPSVCRFCRRFGANGFPDFKLALTSTLSAENIRRVESVKAGDTVGDVISKVVDGAKSATSSVQRILDEATVARVIDAVSQSRRIVLFSQGLSSFVAVDFAARMMNLGFVCESYTDRQSMLLSSVSLRTGDVVIAISGTGENQDVLMSAKEALSAGACVIGLCPDGSSLSENSTLVLKSPQQISAADESFLQSRLPLYLCAQIIIGGVILRRGMAIADSKEKLMSLRNKAYTSQTSEVNTEDKTKADDGSIRPGAPITTLDWHPY